MIYFRGIGNYFEIHIEQYMKANIIILYWELYRGYINERNINEVIMIPDKFAPSKDFLEYHNDIIFLH